MKSGIFKKILSPENETPATPEAPEKTSVPNPFTTSVPPSGSIPPPKPVVPSASAGDAFDDDGDFGFEAIDEADGADAPPPTFAIPAKRQMVQPAPTLTPVDTPAPDEPIRQLELRAVFGVAHDMNEEEILDRARKLKDVRHLNRLADGDADTIDAMRAMVSRLGLGAESVRIYVGNAPVDFIREGRVALAVQTDGGFAPGVRETLILVARELARM